MKQTWPHKITEHVPSPSFIVDQIKLENNLKLLKKVQDESGCKIILALKGFAMFSFADLILQYLPGTTASSLNEAKLAKFDFGGEVHACAPAYHPEEIDELLDYCNHVTFNSFKQWELYKEKCLKKNVKAGLRINPEHSEVKTEIYDPCAKGSRLGITLNQFEGKDLSGISGLHFHTLCELNSDALERTLKVVEEKFGKYFKNIKWVNFGGGHHITRKDYDVKRLISIIKDFKSKYNLEVYLEPGEAIGLNTGVLVSSVLDLIENNGIQIAILDTSATCHMPDVLEMPYRPNIIDPTSIEQTLALHPNEKPYTYRLGGMSCLAGDVIGDYSFDQKLKIGDRLVFLDMGHYTMVKTTMFNGVNLPSIVKCNSETGKFEVVKTFGYEDFKNRLS